MVAFKSTTNADERYLKYLQGDTKSQNVHKVSKTCKNGNVFASEMSVQCGHQGAPPIITVGSIMELLTFCVNTAHFMFQEEIFRQENGAAMGCPVSPLVRSKPIRYMFWFEQYA